MTVRWQAEERVASLAGSGTGHSEALGGQMTLESYGNAQAPDPVLVNIGDIAVTPNYVITPQGRRPVGQVYWTLTEMSRTREAIPAWAIVLAIVFAIFCLLGLLFLLAKETTTEGGVQVSVQGNLSRRQSPGVQPIRRSGIHADGELRALD